MNTFTAKCADVAAAPPDPRKHVNYVQGMVLGVDDMIQDFVYHRHQRQCLAREAIGYGTLSGLHVEVVTRDSAKGPEVAVSPGTALSPRGQLIRVAPRQCAALNQWLALADTQQKLKGQGTPLTGAGVFTAYVVLCFRDCPVDPLPIPGEPCRCDDQAMAPSRILDDFRLELRLAPPAQREEDAIRDFVQWLRQVRIAEGASGYSSLEEFIGALRTAAQDLQSPPDSPPDFLYGSPPQNLSIPAGQLCEYLRAALRLWVTELRPLWQARWSEQVGGGCGCHGDEHTEGGDSEECLLLAELAVPLMSGQLDEAQTVSVNEDRRPIVVHLRMLQEMLLCGPCCGGGCHDRTFATVFALDDQTLRIWIHYPQPVSFDASAVQLEIDDQPVSGFIVTQLGAPESPIGAAPNVFDLDLGISPPISLQPHQRVTLRFDTRLVMEEGSPVRTLNEALRESLVCYPDAAEDSILVFAVVNQSGAAQALAGDVSGLANNNTLVAIQDVPLALPNIIPPGTVLGYDAVSNQWGPTQLPQTVQPLSRPNLPSFQNFGTGGDAGVRPEYARADHIHPMPGLPAIPGQPTSDPVAVESGKPANRGAATGEFARADHAHPLGRVQLGHVVIADPAGSDVRGITERNLVVGLQGVPIAGAPTSPTDDGEVLTFRNGVWQPEPIPAQNAVGDFVEHPTGAGRYLIVAAGHFDNQAKPIGPVYNRLRAVGAISNGVVLLTFGGGGVNDPSRRYINPSDPPDFMYIVKGTIVGKLRGDFHVVAFIDKGIRVQAISTNGDTPVESFMVEISLYFKS